MKIGFITSALSAFEAMFPTPAEPDFISPEPLFTPDDYLAVIELRKHGHEVQPIIWGTAVAELLDYDLLVVRSPWDYMNSEANKTDFLNWVTELDAYNIPLANPAALLNWLLDKHYLKDFADLGVRVIPTVYYTAGARLNLAETFAAQGMFVLKPCVSAAGVGLFFVDSLAAATEHQTEVESAMQQSDYMLQNYISEIRTQGEWSLIFMGDLYSHAILKKPASNSIMVHAERGGSLHFPVNAPPAVAGFAYDVYQQLLPALKHATGIILEPASILYMRIDIIESRDGPMLIECEGVDPELFFRANTGSEARFREALEVAVLTE